MQTSSEIKSQTVVHNHSTPQSRLLEIERDFNVPVHQLFEAFKSPDALKKWWWPKNLHTDRIAIDFRQGGEYFINMKGLNQGGGGMTGRFDEIIENKRIVMSDQFANESGRAISAKEAKMPGEWPEKVFITFEFDSLDENSSRLHLSQEGIPNEVQKDCIQGWTEMFDKLENYFGGPKT